MVDQAIPHKYYAYVLIHYYSYVPRKLHGIHVIFAVPGKSWKIMVDQAAKLSSSSAKMYVSFAYVLHICIIS